MSVRAFMFPSIVVCDTEKNWSALAAPDVQVKSKSTYEDCLSAVAKRRPEILVSSYNFKNGAAQPPNGFEMLRRARKQGYEGPVMVLVGREPNPEQENLKKAARLACSSGELPSLLHSLETTVRGKLRRIGEAEHGSVAYSLTSPPRKAPVSYHLRVFSEGLQGIEKSVEDFAEEKARNYLEMRVKPGYKGDRICAFYFPMPNQLIGFHRYHV